MLIPELQAIDERLDNSRQVLVALGRHADYLLPAIEIRGPSLELSRQCERINAVMEKEESACGGILEESLRVTEKAREVRNLKKWTKQASGRVDKSLKPLVRLCKAFAIPDDKEDTTKGVNSDQSLQKNEDQRHLSIMSRSQPDQQVIELAILTRQLIRAIVDRSEFERIEEQLEALWQTVQADSTGKQKQEK